MAQKEPTTDSSSTVLPPGPRDRAWSASVAAVPTEEETAAIMAVVSLLQPEEPLEVSAPRTSAWALAGRREAVRPWTRQE